MARTIKDLIDELDAEGDRFTFVGLVVGFEKTSTFIWAHEGSSRDRHEKLRDAVRAGGEPVGMVGFVKDPEGGKFYARPLQEYIGEQWVENYLAKLLETTAVLHEASVRTYPRHANKVVSSIDLMLHESARVTSRLNIRCMASSAHRGQ